MIAEGLAESLVSAKNTEINKEIEFKHENYWKSCRGSTVDKIVMTYFAQLLVSISVMAFCMIEIRDSNPQECTGDDNTVWISILSGIVGAYLPKAISMGQK